MTKSKGPLWVHFIHISHDQGKLKAKFNEGQHFNAWCMYCTDQEVENVIDDAEDQVLASAAGYLDARWLKEQRRLRVMPSIKPVRGVKETLLSHLRVCLSKPASLNLDTIFTPNVNGPNSETSMQSASSASQPQQLRQTILQVQPKSRQFTREQIADFQKDTLHMLVGLNAAFVAIDQPVVKSFFKKWIGLDPPSEYVCRNCLLKASIMDLDEEMAKAIKGKDATLSCDGWNNRRKKHLVAYVLSVDGKAYSTKVHDNSGDYKSGVLMAD